jgi:hypothetical protein
VLCWLGGGRTHPRGPWGWFGHPQGPKRIIFFFFLPWGVVQPTHTGQTSQGGGSATPLLLLFFCKKFIIFNHFLKISIFNFFYVVSRVNLSG